MNDLNAYRIFRQNCKAFLKLDEILSAEKLNGYIIDLVKSALTALEEESRELYEFIQEPEIYEKWEEWIKIKNET